MAEVIQNADEAKPRHQQAAENAGAGPAEEESAWPQPASLEVHNQGTDYTDASLGIRGADGADVTVREHGSGEQACEGTVSTDDIGPLRGVPVSTAEGAETTAANTTTTTTTTEVRAVEESVPSDAVDDATVLYPVVELKSETLQSSDSSDSDVDVNEVSAGASPYFMIRGEQRPRVTFGGPEEEGGDDEVPGPVARGGGGGDGGYYEVGQEAVAPGECPVDPSVLQDLEQLACKAAMNLDHMMVNLRNGLYAMTVCMRQMTEVHGQSLGNMQKAVEVSTKSMYTFLAKFEELDNNLEPLKDLSSQISDISETLKTLEKQFRT